MTRYDLPDGPVVLKEWAPATSRLLRWWARMLMRREIRHYERLDGAAGIPRFRGAYDETAFVIEWVDGTPLSRAVPSPLMEAALDGLERTLDEIHARRFAHLDLHQKLNALIRSDGHVWLIDLGQGMDCTHWTRRWLFPLFARIDRNAVLKFRARYAPHTLDAANRDRIVRRYGKYRGRSWKQFRRRLRKRLIGTSS